MPPERDGEGQGRRATSLCPSCRPRSRTPQQGNRGAVDRVVPKDAVLQPLHQRRRYIRADKAHEARRRTPTRFNAASPNVAQTYSTRASLKRALRGRLIAEKGGPQRDWQAGWKGAHARRDDGEQALASKRAQGRRARARSARSRNRAGSGRKHVERARRRQKGRAVDAAVQVVCGRREGGGRHAAEDLLRGRVRAPMRPLPSRAVRHSAPTPRPTPRTWKSDE